MDTEKTLLRYLRIAVGLLIFLLGWMMVDKYYQEQEVSSAPISVTETEGRPPQFTIPLSFIEQPQEQKIQTTEQVVEVSEFITNPSPIPSPEYTRFWTEFDSAMSKYVTVGNEDSMKFQRANIRKSFLDYRGMIVDQDTGRVFTRTGTLVSIDTLNCHLSGFNPAMAHIIVNCP